MDITVGTLITFMGKKGEVKYVGPFADREGTYVGIELEVPKGKNSGIIKGIKMFDCKENHGIFARIEDIQRTCKIIGPQMRHSVSFDATPKLDRSSTPVKSSPLTESASPLTYGLMRSRTASSEFLVESKEELENKLKKYQDFIATSKEKINDVIQKTKLMLDAIVKKESDQKEEFNGVKQEFAKIIFQKQIKIEQELIQKEEECIQSARRVRILAEAADGRVSNEKIMLLQKINNAHIEYQQLIQQLLDAQRINLNTVNRSIQTLKKRVPRTEKDLNRYQRVLEGLKNEIEKYEEEGMPDWSKVADLKEKVDEMTAKNKRLELEDKMSKIDVDVTSQCISDLVQKDNPLIFLALKVNILHAKVKAYSDFANGKKQALAFYLLYLLEFVQIILTGYHSKITGFQEIFDELDSISNSIDNGKLVLNTNKLVGLIKGITYIQLENCLTPSLLKYIAFLSTNPENKAILTDIANEIDISLHTEFVSQEDAKILSKIIGEIKASQNGGVFGSIDDLLNLYEKYEKREFDLVKIFQLREDEDKKAQEKLQLLAEQEKDKFEDQVKKMEEERDQLNNQRLQLLEQIKTAKDKQ